MQVQTLSIHTKDEIYTVPNKLEFDAIPDPSPLALLVRSASKKIPRTVVICPPTTDRFGLEIGSNSKGPILWKKLSNLTAKGEGKVCVCRLEPKGTATFTVSYLPHKSEKNPPNSNFQDAISVHSEGYHLLVPLFAKCADRKIKGYKPDIIKYPSVKAIRSFLQAEKLSHASEQQVVLEEMGPKPSVQPVVNEIKGDTKGVFIPELANLAKWSLMTAEEKKKATGNQLLDESTIDNILSQEYDKSDDDEMAQLEESSLKSARYRKQLPVLDKRDHQVEDVDGFNPSQIVGDSKTETEVAQAEEEEFYKKILESARLRYNSAASQVKSKQ